MKHKHKQSGFTVVELMIVIVVIAILAAVTIATYGGVQQRARDTQRLNDIAIITEGLDLYYMEHGEYPAGSGWSSDSEWSTTTEPESWQALRNKLVPDFISALPDDPSAMTGVDPRYGTGKYGYSYFSNSGSNCGAQPRQMYILTYRTEAVARQDKLIGDCATNPKYYAEASNYRVVNIQN